MYTRLFLNCEAPSSIGWCVGGDTKHRKRDIELKYVRAYRSTPLMEEAQLLRTENCHWSSILLMKEDLYIVMQMMGVQSKTFFGIVLEVFANGFREFPGKQNYTSVSDGYGAEVGKMHLMNCHGTGDDGKRCPVWTQVWQPPKVHKSLQSK